MSTLIRVRPAAPKGSFTAPPSPLRRGRVGGKCACGGTPDSTGECAQCRAKRLAAQRGQAPTVTVSGSALEPRARAALETRFGHDFSRVPLGPQGFDLAVESRVERPGTRSGFLGDSGTPPDEERVAQEQEQAPSPAPAPGVFPPSPPPPPQPAPAASCSYTITYANQQNLGCPAGRCGAKIQYDITNVSASGSGCPPKLEGLRITESVTTDNGCGPGNVRTGPGCPIGPGGTVTGCTDVYALCLPTATVPSPGCTERYTQHLYVGGQHAETHTITFTLTNPQGGPCSGTVSRS